MARKTDGNLILTRREGESVVLQLPGGGSARITVASIVGDRRPEVRLSFECPLDVRVMRGELLTPPGRE